LDFAGSLMDLDWSSICSLSSLTGFLPNWIDFAPNFFPNWMDFDPNFFPLAVALSHRLPNTHPG